MYYSSSTNGFYNAAIHGDNIPVDAVKITAEQHAELLEGQSQGKYVIADENGKPVLQEPDPATPEEIEQLIKSARATAYREESDPLFFKWQAGESTQAEWQAKRDEIRQRFPKEQLS